jgi:hypothetical protein
MSERPTGAIKLLGEANTRVYILYNEEKKKKTERKAIYIKCLP